MSDQDLENIINCVGIVVNAFLAWWIVSNIQKKQSNDRSVKDHCVSEIKDLREDCRNFLKAVYGGKKKHREIIPTLKLLGIKSTHIMNVLGYGFSLDRSYLNSYFLEMNKIITDDPNFVSCTNPSADLTLTADSLDKLLRFQATYQNRFNDLILSINEAEYRNLLH